MRFMHGASFPPAPPAPPFTALERAWSVRADDGMACRGRLLGQGAPCRRAPRWYVSVLKQARRHHQHADSLALRGLLPRRQPLCEEVHLVLSLPHLGVDVR